MNVPFLMLEFGQLTVQVQAGPMTEQNMAAHLASEGERIREAIAENGLRQSMKGVVIVDGSVDLVPPPSVRKMQADWIDEHYEALRATVGGMAFVVPSAMARGALTAALWLTKMPMPFTLHERLELALDWGIAEVDRHGGDVTTELLLGGTMAVENARNEALATARHVVTRAAPGQRLFRSA